VSASEPPPPVRVAWIDAAAGIAGDMLLGALVDAGLEARVLEGVVRSLGLEDVSLAVRRVTRGPLAATKVDVLVDGEVAEGPAGHGHEHHHDRAHERHHDHGHGGAHDHGHRTLSEVLAIVDRARDLAPAALADARRVFRALAEAEGRVHGVAAETVRFHEVGALDALVDVVGCCVGLRALGVTEVRVSALPWPDGGTLRSAHGALALPAPAVAHLLLGRATFPSAETFEQVTPTGAALVRALATGGGVPVGFVPRAVGVGAGTRDAGRLPNVVRLVVGDLGAATDATDAVLLETNLDDATGQSLARALERALAEGALDAWVVPATMKKGRPGHVLSVLVRPGDETRLEQVLFAETPTLGVRRSPVARRVLARHHVDVRTPFGSVRVKVREGPSGPEGTPEHDDCRKLAEARGVPLLDVQRAAMDAWAVLTRG
jgi:pyridinium-3,5-bisthiocarboxylic acid mononucleotide nickel chelatase